MTAPARLFGPIPLRPTHHKHRTLLEILGACPGVDISKHSGGRYQYVPAPWLVRSMPIVCPSSTTCTPIGNRACSKRLESLKSYTRIDLPG